jgi:hypothetical protein
MPTCQAGRTITINNEAHTYKPDNLCVTAGDVIRVNVTPSGTATIRSKSGDWPNGSNGSERSFTITAPPVTAETSYDYNVFFSDGSCKDPRITVKK